MKDKSKEIFIIAIVGVLLAVALVQAFELNELTEKASGLDDITVSLGGSQPSQTTQAARAPTTPSPSATQMVGGC